MEKKFENYSKKSQKERKSENRLLQIYFEFLEKKVMTFFLWLLILVTGRFHLQKSREIKSELSVCVHYTNFL